MNISEMLSTFWLRFSYPLRWKTVSPYRDPIWLLTAVFLSFVASNISNDALDISWNGSMICVIALILFGYMKFYKKSYLE